MRSLHLLSLIYNIYVIEKKRWPLCNYFGKQNKVDCFCAIEYHGTGHPQGNILIHQDNNVRNNSTQCLISVIDQTHINCKSISVPVHCWYQNITTLNLWYFINPHKHDKYWCEYSNSATVISGPWWILQQSYSLLLFCVEPSCQQFGQPSTPWMESSLHWSHHASIDPVTSQLSSFKYTAT